MKSQGNSKKSSIYRHIGYLLNISFNNHGFASCSYYNHIIMNLKIFLNLWRCQIQQRFRLCASHNKALSASYQLNTSRNNDLNSVIKIIDQIGTKPAINLFEIYLFVVNI